MRRSAPAVLAVLAGVAGAGCDLESEIGPGDDRMPTVVGKSAKDANEILDGRGFAPNYGSAVPVDENRCRVVYQRSPGGSQVQPYSTQPLRCVVEVPRVVGRTADDAELILQRVGLDSDFSPRLSAARRVRCRIAGQDGRREARPQTDIRLRLRCRASPPRPER